MGIRNYRPGAKGWADMTKLAMNLNMETIEDWWENHPDVPSLCAYWEEITTWLIQNSRRDRVEIRNLKKRIAELEDFHKPKCGFSKVF